MSNHLTYLVIPVVQPPRTTMSTIRNLILGVLPVLSRHTLHILVQTFAETAPSSQIYSAASLFNSDALRHVTVHPEQHGFRISMEALEGLPTWDCLYHFWYG
jgi:hypothetical protein